METTAFHEKGNISIHTENIFPIIKKFLYSDHEIFLRELVSNAVDATQKIKRLASLGEYGGELGDLAIKVSIDKEAKTLTISDKGIGMTADEIKKYINQIAFSGALEFVEKYKDQGVERGAIIGQFGLGFYSAFMVASQVEIITKSYQDAPAARWICDGSTEFEITAAEKAERGTDIILHITEDSQEFLEPARVNSILEKYGKFLPIPVSFEDKVINETEPIWTKNPNELADEDYLKFYETLYPFSEKPLFWIHLNVDYPFNLTGILYFPKIKNELQLSREKIQLYSRQVFITDEVKDVVPDFLMLLHGVIDSPDIPLNVSRSFLQADSNVKKINGYITRKVADKLSELFHNDRHGYEEKFGDIGVFVKYGMISEDKFYDKAKDIVLLESTRDTFYTLEEYKEKTEETQKDKDDNLVWLYTTDTGKQDSYIQTAMARGYNVLKLDGVIDPHFIGKMEQKLDKTTFKRVDADSLDKLIDKGVTIESILTEEEKGTLKTTFEGVAGAGYSVEIQPLSTDELPVVITQNEFMRRMNDMSKAGGQPAFFGSMPVTYNLLINANHPAISRVKDSNDQALAKQLVDLAQLSQGLLSGPALTEFIKRTVNSL